MRSIPSSGPPPSPEVLVRPLVQRLQPYVPGEQPKAKGFIKLNTNENPYGPAPAVLEALKAALDGRLRLYPDPTAEALRERLARFHGCAPENIIVGNGSDELLALATRAFVEPSTGGIRPAVRRSTVQYFSPSYSLYPVLAQIQGAFHNPVSLDWDFGLPTTRELAREKRWDFQAALTFVTTPNAPTGRGYPTSELEALCQAQAGVVVLDEAYADFAPENALALALKHPQVLVARTFSKGYSLCALRVGYFVGPPPLIAVLAKLKDSYNVNGLGQVAALATLEHLSYYRANFRRLLATRDWLCKELTNLGFVITPSQTNFIFARPPGLPPRSWLLELRTHKILVRWFDTPETRGHLRISVGTEEEAEALVKAARQIVLRLRNAKTTPE